MNTSMSIILSVLLCLCQSCHGLRARINLQRNVDYVAAPIHEKCGTSALEHEIASKLGDATPDENPFASCGSGQVEMMRELFAHGSVNICAVGKLAKNGNFFASKDGALIIKGVTKKEAQVLMDWNALALRPWGCEPFRTTSMVQVFASFVLRNQPFVVMPNVTHYLAQASPSVWRVQDVYDAKPLPNLGQGTVKLFKDLQNSWGQDIGNINTWEGWTLVRNQLSKDLGFLGDRVVDFSLFVHVLRSDGDTDDIPVALVPNRGCIADPSRHLMLCFHILDYLTPFTWIRELESKHKAAKFVDYAAKFQLAFDCIGDIFRGDCAHYKNLASITEAMSVSKSMAKAVLIGVTAFPQAYTCTDMEPSQRYIELEEGDAKTSYNRTQEVPDLVAKVEWRENAQNSSELAEWLQSAASQEAGTTYIGEACTYASAIDTDYKCTATTLEYAHLQSGLSLYSKNKKELNDLDACATLVNEFATETYTSKGKRSESMHNVLWAPSLQSIIAVRGLPKIPVARFLHKKALERARSRWCFLKSRYLLCKPKDAKRVYFDYKQRFDTLEVMVLTANEHSSDAQSYANLINQGKKIGLFKDASVDDSVD